MNTATNIAKSFERIASHLARDERGFVTDDYRPLMNRIRQEAVEVHFPFDDDALVPTMVFVYRDGSALLVDCSTQEEHPLRINEMVSPNNHAPALRSVGVFFRSSTCTSASSTFD